MKKRYFLLLLLIFSGIFLTGAKQVFADGLSASDAQKYIPSDVRTFPTTGGNCSGGPLAAGAWLSQVNDSIRTTFTVTYGAPTIDVWYNLDAKSCKPHQPSEVEYLLSVAQANYNNQIVPLAYPNSHNTGNDLYFSTKHIPLTVTLQDADGNNVTSITKSGIYYVSIVYKAISKITVKNKFGTNMYQCNTKAGDSDNPAIVYDQPPVKASDYDRCGTTNTGRVPVDVTVLPRKSCLSEQSLIDGKCVDNTPLSFSVRASPQEPDLQTDEEDPLSVTFDGSIINTSAAPQPRINGLKVSRSYYVKRVNGSKVDFNPVAGTADTFEMIGASHQVAHDSRSLAGFNLLAGDQVCQDLNVTPPHGTVKSDGTITQSDKDIPAVTSCATVSNRPYVRVYGGEVVAGACSVGGPASDIIAFARKQATGWIGAGAQFGAYTNGQIHNFSTANLYNPFQPTTLAFANTAGSDDGPLFGGGFNSTFCANDYWTNVPDIEPFGSTVLDATTMGRHQLPAGITLTQTAAIAHSTTIYINGDVTIGSNLTTTTNWATLADIPSLYIIARGNIYIRPDVTEIDGGYIASSGHIYTCFNTSKANTDSQFVATSCGKKLTIYGALIAQKVNFLRVNGSLRGAVTTATNGEVAGSLNIAETIQYSPELLLGQPALDKTTVAHEYDAINSLAPSL